MTYSVPDTDYSDHRNAFGYDKNTIRVTSADCKHKQIVFLFLKLNIRIFEQFEVFK